MSLVLGTESDFLLVGSTPFVHNQTVAIDRRGLLVGRARDGWVLSCSDCGSVVFHTGLGQVASKKLGRMVQRHWDTYITHWPVRHDPELP